MYLSEDIRLNILEYSSDINIKVSDEALLERIQVIDPSFCLSHVIQDFNRQKEDEKDPMYPLFSILCKYKGIYINNIQGSSISIKWKSNNGQELHDIIKDRYPNVSIIFTTLASFFGLITNNLVLNGIDTNNLYRLLVTYKNRYDPLDYNLIELHSRMEVMKEDTGFMSHMKHNNLLHLYNDPIYSSDEIPMHIDPLFSLRDQLRLAIEKSNRDRYIKSKIESLRLSHAYPLWLQMKDIPYRIHVDMNLVATIFVNSSISLIFPEGLVVNTHIKNGNGYGLYVLSGDLSIISDLALLSVLHDNYNYNFDKDTILLN